MDLWYDKNLGSYFKDRGQVIYNVDYRYRVIYWSNGRIRHAYFGGQVASVEFIYDARLVTSCYNISTKNVPFEYLYYLSAYIFFIFWSQFS